MQEVELTELGELLPMDLELWGVAGGQPIHSSQKIVDKVKNWVSDSPFSKSISKKIHEGLDKKRILVGFERKGKLRFIWRRFTKRYPFTFPSFSKTKVENTVGYYVRDERTLVVVFDNNVNIVGRAIAELPPVFNHELCHFAFSTNINKALKQLMRPILLPFYKTYLGLLTPKTQNVDDKYLIETIIRLAKAFEPAFRPGIVKSLYNIWEDYVSKVSDDEKFNKTLLGLILLPYAADIIHLKMKKRERNLAKDSQTAFLKTYGSIFGVKGFELWGLGITTPGQEAIFPSEVVAVTNQFRLTPPVINLINSIDMR